MKLHTLARLRRAARRGAAPYTAGMGTPRVFADYCCELLCSLGPLQARRMFGGWGLSVDGLTVAIVVNLGDGDTLWLKANDATRPQFEAAGCRRFTYDSRKGSQIVVRSVNYYSAPKDAMDCAQAMESWARLSLQAAVAARSTVGAKPRAPTLRKPSTARQG